MSKRLALSAALSVLAMSTWVLFSGSAQAVQLGPNGSTQAVVNATVAQLD